ncbi:NAD(P)/FAD-dependent oxidoreductase [Nitriliruptor alkaliphilus]|uniref:NAD(P)/FAD-dependent oxidoreductase n=1 Tax=Nitriliruptor alkaliphilus TaxID=427918 RepID=UPI000AC381C5|nr:NAD(P)/FAD-dependent oxidoreductase [Nitriliruptor alkaliphilus]
MLVVGGGPAGLSAATWLGRYRRRTLLVDAGDHRNRAVEAVHGLLGRDPVTPAQLRQDALEGLSRYPHVTVRQGTVSGLDHADEGFEVEVDGQCLHASRVVLATGVRDRLPAIDGLAEHYGAGLQHCPTCEGFEARGRPVVVLGWGAHVPAFATELLDWASEVVVVSDGTPLQVTDAQRRQLDEVGIELVDGRAEALLGPRGDLHAVRLVGGRELPAAMAFFSIGHDPTVELARGLGCALTDEGVIAVDHEQGTSVAGVFAAGDVTPGMQLVAVAIGEGATAGVACAQSLQGRATVPGAPPAAPSPELLAP